jgi:2'-5' RNA ligase
MHSFPLPPPTTLSPPPPGQLWLPEILSPGPPTDGLFFAIFPDLQASASLAREAWQLRTKHELLGRPLRADRFHVTLHHFGCYHGLRRDFVAMAREAAGEIMAAPFSVTFDRAMSFGHGPEDWLLVLRGDDRLEALKNFRNDLGASLWNSGFGRKIVKRFTPHVSLIYEHRRVAEQQIEPVTWTVTEFVLVHSLLGQTQHIELGRWPLRG